MGAAKISFFAFFAALAAAIFIELFRTKEPVYVDGTVERGYEKVKELFIKNFEDGWEREGATFAVFVNGTKVVDLWGGYADHQAERKWKKDTMSITFSTTKAVAAVCVALLVDRGRLRYDDLIATYWPGFAKHGKGNVTVQMALSHEAGLGYLDTPITEEIAADHNKIREILENERPKWEPGRMNGYHAYTYGWIVDQIIRHVDEKHRSIGQFLREEITGPHHIDYYIGLPFEEEYRMARLSVPTMWERISEVLYDWRVSRYFLSLWKFVRDTPLSRATNNPSWLQAVARCTLNNPDYHHLEQAAALGIGNARSLAAIFNLVATQKLLSEQVLNRLQHHYNNDTDVIFDDVIAKGHGFLYMPLHRAGTEFLVGHTGHGCQQVVYDLKNQVSIAYVNNGLKTGLYDLYPSIYLEDDGDDDKIEEFNNLLVGGGATKRTR
ncbi:unnamed protein product [Cylicocyclus nassatus]|uniref:Beta-lactamase-related domain-containing protein n=1 Tax=Cylicocyclus nassatus TaxID=53992 RepID=A0AA36MB35_CYLNA|nr:unnamed protein product [Cylicocyclus nassatus]